MFLVVAAFVGYQISCAVERKQIAQMILLVAILMGIQTTVIGLTPTINAIRSRADSLGSKLDKIDKLTSVGFGSYSWPVKGPIAQGYSSQNHGVDIACTEGSPVIAMGDGKVSKVGMMDIYGLTVIVDYDRGIQGLYAHLSKVVVKEGYPVVAGTKIALSGNTGNSTGPHLHFELRKNGATVDPLDYLLK